MRQLAMAATAILVFALIPPAVAQPFADTPTNHWAYDAIAELAAKGLIEGYPDGTFKGDRAMTRYEMAMVVARLLARIESIQIPTPPPPKPEVTKADIDKILRLVNEFRAELAAKNVRLTAVEEELNAIKAKLDNVRITGAYQFRYNLDQQEPNLAFTRGSFPTVNGNPRTSSTSASTVSRSNRSLQRFKIQFDGSVAPDVHFITAIISCGGPPNCPAGSAFQTFNSSSFGPGSAFILSTIDIAFFDWKNAFGWPLEIWLGRFGGKSPGPRYPVQFGPLGLLFNTATHTWRDTTANSGANSADGLRVALRFSNLADLQFQGAWVRITGGAGAFTYPSGEDAYGGDIRFKVIDRLRVGGYYVANTIAQAGSAPFTGPSPFGVLYHLYGPSGSMNPGIQSTRAFTSDASGLRCIASGPGTAKGGPGSVAGTNCPAQGNGWGAYAIWDALPGIHLDVEAAQWSDTTPGGGTDSGYHVLGTFDLGKLLRWKGVVVTAGYQFYGANFYPPYGNVDWDIVTGLVHIYPGNAQGFTASASWAISPTFTVFENYLTGNHVSNSQTLLEWQAGVIIRLAPNASILFKYRDLSINGIDQENVYRAEISYRF